MAVAETVSVELPADTLRSIRDRAKMARFAAHEQASAACLSADERRTLFALLRKLNGL